MKKTKITLIAFTALIIAACSSTKKSSKSTASSAPASTTTTASKSLFLFANPAPGNEELIAIQTQYKDVTLDKLKEGHAIYTQGACTNCHDAKNIYILEEAEWKNILDDMAQKAEISDIQQDAVYKYVLSIKAMQPK